MKERRWDFFEIVSGQPLENGIEVGGERGRALIQSDNLTVARIGDQFGQACVATELELRVQQISVLGRHWLTERLSEGAHPSHPGRSSSTCGPLTRRPGCSRTTQRTRPTCRGASRSLNGGRTCCS